MIQKLKLAPRQVLTKDNVRHSLERARSTYDYCRIYMKNGKYITIAFFRDNSCDIMTNIHNYGLWHEIEFVRRTPVITLIADYVFNWIQRYNR